MAVIEFSRNILGLNKANSTEMDINCEHPVISMMESQKNIKEKGGTMRLGSWRCVIENNSLAYKIYSTNSFFFNLIESIYNLTIFTHYCF